jgi:hypothetical protein
MLYCGPVVQRLGHSPFKAATRVRVPSGSPVFVRRLSANEDCHGEAALAAKPGFPRCARSRRTSPWQAEHGRGAGFFNRQSAIEIRQCRSVGPVVQRLGHSPLKAKTRVRVPSGSPVFVRRISANEDCHGEAASAAKPGFHRRARSRRTSPWQACGLLSPPYVSSHANDGCPPHKTGVGPRLPPAGNHQKRTAR